MVKNNNPGNIERVSGEEWRGQVVTKLTRWVEFRHSSWGIRAVALAIESFVKNHKDGTTKILGEYAIKRWVSYAPTTGMHSREKEQASKRFRLNIQRVTNGTRSISEYTIIRDLVESAIVMEQGANPYTEKELNSGLARAGFDVPNGSLVNSRILWGSIVAGVSTSLNAALDGSDLPFLMELLSIQYPEIYDLSMYGITGLGLLAVIWARVEDQNTRI